MIQQRNLVKKKKKNVIFLSFELWSQLVCLFLLNSKFSGSDVVNRAAQRKGGGDEMWDK